MRSPTAGLFLAMLSVALAFAVVLSVGFWLSSHYPALAANSTVFGAAAAFAIVFAAAAIARVLGIPIRFWRQAPLRAAPGTHGDVRVSPEFSAVSRQRIDYRNDPSMTITCPHLEPI